MTGKRKSKPYRERSRQDWDRLRTKVMRWVLRVKLVQNWQGFATLLLDTGSHPIVEDSRRDDFWGAIAEGTHTLVGRNVLGRLLMEVREQVRSCPREHWHLIRPPNIDNFLLFGQEIEPVSGIETDLHQVEAVRDQGRGALRF